MSEFTSTLTRAAAESNQHFITGPPGAMTRQTWGDVHRHGRRIAGGLASEGIGRGAVVGVLASEPVDVAPVIQAIWMRGGSVTMLHQPTPRTDPAVWAHEINTVAAMIGVDLIVLGAPFEYVAEILAEVGLRFRLVSELAASDESTPLDAAEEDIAFLQLTSGSTGTPKAVSITHANLHFNARAMSFTAKGDLSSDVMVSWLPLSHDFGMIGFLVWPMWAGSGAVCVTPRDFLRNPLVWAELISDYGGTMTGAPNFAYAILARRLQFAADGAVDLSTLRLAMNGAEPIDPAAVDALTAAGAKFGLKPTALVPAYGMAEATLCISYNPPGSPVQVDFVDAAALHTDGLATPSSGPSSRGFVLLGTPLPGIQVRVTDDDGACVDVRRVGEFQVRGPQITDRYFTEHGPQAAVDRHGWLPTGDLGYLTESGELVVCGRKKDIIIVSGRNIFPTDIERAAERVDGVRKGSAVAIRMNDDGAREDFCVAVESTSHHIREEVARMEKAISKQIYDTIGVPPNRVLVLHPGTVPKTPSGKLRRRESRKLLDTTESIAR